MDRWQRSDACGTQTEKKGWKEYRKVDYIWNRWLENKHKIKANYMETE